MARQPVDILFPHLGVSRVAGFQAQPPYSAPDALNVRPDDVFERRRRGGSRPGLLKAFSQELGSGSPVRLLNSVLTGQELPATENFEEPFDTDPLAATWSIWDGGTPATDAVLPSVASGRAFLDAFPPGQLHVGAMQDLIDYNTSAAIDLESQYFTANGSKNFKDIGNNDMAGARWRWALGLTGTTNYDGGVVVTIGVTAGAGQTFSIQVDNQGSTLLSTQIGSVSGNVIRLVYLGGTLQIFLGSANNLAYTVSGLTLSGKRIAFGMWHGGSTVRDFGIEYLNFRTTAAASSVPIAEPALVAASGGIVYYESASGTMTSVDDPTPQNTDVASDRLLTSAEAFGKLYIADYKVKAEGTDGVTTGSGATFSFDSATYADWTDIATAAADEIDVDGDMIELLAGGTGVYTPGVYRITSVAAGDLTLTWALTDPATAPVQSGGAIPFRIVRAVKVFDYRLTTTNKLTMLTRQLLGPPDGLTDTQINPPLGCTIATIFQERLCLSGDPENPGDIFMSKSGDFTTWQEDTTDLSAVYGEFSVNTRINEPVRALIPYLLDYLVIGGVDSIRVLRGNPMRGGIIDTISRSVGIIGPFAWCNTPESILLVMTGDGLYVIDSMAQQAAPISRERLPKEFTGLDTTNNDVQLAFDVRRNGVIIAVTPKTVGRGTYYWFDWSTKSFWPEEYQIDHAPTAMVSYLPSGDSTQKVVFGGRDGYIRTHQETSSDDDGTDFSSQLLIGPLALGGGGYFDGMLRELIPQISSQSNPVNVGVRVGRSIEDAYRAATIPLGTATAGKGLTKRPNLRGNCCFIVIEGADGLPWAYEQMTMVREPLRKQRLITA